jgi:MFS family permease
MLPHEDRLVSKPGDASGDEDGRYGYSTMEKVDPNERARRPSVYRRESFIVQFATSEGPPQIVALAMMIAFGFGATVGVVPTIMTERFARLNHGYSGEVDCDINGSKPDECYAGSADAQNAAALSNLISNALTLLTSSMIGSLSDVHGRRGVLLLGVFLACLSPSCLLIVQMRPKMSPFWYYGAKSSTGLVNWMAIAISSLGDVLPAEWRAPGVGILMAGFMLGLSLAPTLALFITPFQISLLSFLVVFGGFVLTVLFFPETLPPEVAREARRRLEGEAVNRNLGGKIWWNLQRPLRELSIVNRNGFFRLLSLLAFFSGIVTAGDHTLLIYYIEERLSFNLHDVALLFVFVGGFGVVAQAFVLKPLNDLIGERLVVVMCFTLASFVNLMYGVAKEKSTIFIAIIISAFTGMAFPTISAIKANNVVSQSVILISFLCVSDQGRRRFLTHYYELCRKSPSKVVFKARSIQFKPLLLELAP